MTKYLLPWAKLSVSSIIRAKMDSVKPLMDSESWMLPTFFWSFCGYQLGLPAPKSSKSKHLTICEAIRSQLNLERRTYGYFILSSECWQTFRLHRSKKHHGKKVFSDLLKTSDALIENFRPGVMDRLGFSFDACCKIKEPLVYCAISGFGQEGPLRITQLTIKLSKGSVSDGHHRR